MLAVSYGIFILLTPTIFYVENHNKPNKVSVNLKVLENHKNYFITY